MRTVVSCEKTEAYRCAPGQFQGLSTGLRHVEPVKKNADRRTAPNADVHQSGTCLGRRQ
ncbi:hypothetical protein PANT111_160021 [Pantoea brenneri]|uniref:Uncharacterized protein n=1 Tax=Pantoea brenneri TaxID=472694 RepID=A0AAX3J3Y7_9GAMM|nr:hypothetical protein PANT111_160021 [Pantoea brenneri]